MSMEAYSVAIRLKLIDSVSTGLIGLAAQFRTFNQHISTSEAGLLKIEQSLQRIKLMGVVGGAMLGAGGAMLYGLKAPLEAAREYELAFTKFKALNFGDTINKQADAFARGTHVMGVSSKELMTTLSETVGMFGSYAEAQKHAAQLSQLNVANSAVFGGKLEGLDEGTTRALLKFIDRRGGLASEDAYQRALNLAERLVTGSGGFIKFSDLNSFSQYGGTAFRGLSDQGVTNLSLLLQEQGGARAGTSMMSIYQNLIAGRTPKKTMQMLEDYGLGTMHEVYSGKVGGKRSTTTTFALKDQYASILQSDPVGFFRDVFLPILAAHGITSESGILKATNDMLSNRTASSQASIMTTQLLQIARDAKLTQNAMGVDQVTAQFAKDPNARWVELTKQYRNLMVELGEAVLPIAVNAVRFLTGAIRGFLEFAREFPTVTKGLVIAFTGLAALMVTGGAVTLIIASLKALGLALSVAGSAAGAATGGLGAAALASKAGKLGVLGLTGLGAYEITDLIANKWLGLDAKLGGLFAPKYDATRGNYINHGKDRSGPQTGTVYLDKRKVGSILFEEQSRDLNRPQTGTGQFDTLQGMTPAGGL